MRSMMMTLITLLILYTKKEKITICGELLFLCCLDQTYVPFSSRKFSFYLLFQEKQKSIKFIVRYFINSISSTALSLLYSFIFTALFGADFFSCRHPFPVHRGFCRSSRRRAKELFPSSKKRQLKENNYEKKSLSFFFHRL